MMGMSLRKVMETTQRWLGRYELGTPWNRCGRLFAFEDPYRENIEQRKVSDEAEEETIYWCLWKAVEELEREVVTEYEKESGANGADPTPGGM
jgi:hypothetical protein